MELSIDFLGWLSACSQCFIDDGGRNRGGGPLLFSKKDSTFRSVTIRIVSYVKMQLVQICY